MRISRGIGAFGLDRAVFWLLLTAAALVGIRAWLAENPQHDPWAPLDINDPPGRATQGKLVALREDVAACRAVLERSDVAFTILPPEGEGACRREDRTVLSSAPLSPSAPAATCAVGAGFQIWVQQGVQPAAERLLGSPVAQIEHLGSYSCRRLYGRDEGPWSEHATGNAIDIAGFVLEDGRRVSVLRDWNGSAEEAAFLRDARDAACDIFGTVLSPDYNAAHADHFHLDQAARSFGGTCR